MGTKIKPPDPNAFTLIEVVMTLAIVGLILIPLVGLTGIASKSSFDADTISISSSIANRIMGEIQQADQEQIEQWRDLNAQDFLFDFQGLELDETNQDEAVFTARLTLENEGLDLGANTSSNYAIGAVLQIAAGENGARILDEIEADPSLTRVRSVRTFRTVLINLENESESN